MARIQNKFKAQLLTVDGNGKEYKRNFSNVRADISDDELTDLSVAIKNVLNEEDLKNVGLTSNSSLRLD